MDPAVAQGLHERAGDVLLATNFGKTAGPVLAVEREAHR